MCDVVDSNIIEPTSHELRSKASAASWAGIQNHTLTVMTVSFLPRFGVSNVHGPLGFYCEGCLLVCHRSVNIFRLPEKWRWVVFHFRTITMYEFCSIIDVRPNHV